MQLIATSLFEDAAPVSGPIVELSFDEKVANAVAVIKRHILDGKRFIGASSFGKDSSVMVALTLMAMQQLKESGFAVPEFHVMTSNTRVENPVVEAYSQGEIRALKAFAQENGLPVRVWVCSPNLTENWLVSIIGGRTIASLPGNSAKCQQQLKKDPLDRTKRQIKAVLKKEMGAAYSEDNVVVLIGTRRDESAVRERNMEARGESAIEPVNTAKPNKKPAWVLSPIADFTTDDIFTFLAMVTNDRIKTYSDFKALTEVYRDAAGECMVNAFVRDNGVERKTGCGARHVAGCACAWLQTGAWRTCWPRRPASMPG